MIKHKLKRKSVSSISQSSYLVIEEYSKSLTSSLLRVYQEAVSREPQRTLVPICILSAQSLLEVKGTGASLPFVSLKIFPLFFPTILSHPSSAPAPSLRIVGARMVYKQIIDLSPKVVIFCLCIRGQSPTPVHAHPQYRSTCVKETMAP